MQDSHRPGAQDAPWLSVIVTTRDRPEGVVRAVDSIVAHSESCALEVVVVDDGSTPENAIRLDRALQGAAHVVHQPNTGLCGARATGVAHSNGRWLAFLDDDDVLLDTWSSALLPLMDAADVGMVSGAARLMTPEGELLATERPRPLGPMFGGVTAQYLAGCFAVRRGLYDAAGGYLPGLSSSHQTELFLRLTQRLAECDLRARSTDIEVVSVERRPVEDRPLSDPRFLYDGTRWILARHAPAFELDRLERSNWEAVVAVNAARLGEWSAARRWALRSLRSWPTRRSSWARSVLALVPPLGRRYWGVSSGRAAGSPQAAPLVHAAALLDGQDGGGADGVDRWFLPWGYHERRAVSVGSDGTTHRGEVLEAGVLEASEDPRQELRRLRARLQPGRSGVVHARVRARGSARRSLGPPSSSDRRREWHPDELELLLESAGLRAVRRAGWRPLGTLARIVRRSPRASADGGGRGAVTFLVRPTSEER